MLLSIIIVYTDYQTSIKNTPFINADQSSPHHLQCPQTAAAQALWIKNRKFYLY